MGQLKIGGVNDRTMLIRLTPTMIVARFGDMSKKTPVGKVAHDYTDAERSLLINMFASGGKARTLWGAEKRTATRLWDRNPPLVFVGTGGIAHLTAEGQAVARELHDQVSIANMPQARKAARELMS